MAIPLKTLSFVSLVAPDATVIVLKGTGHWMLEENYRETADALLKFL